MKYSPIFLICFVIFSFNSTLRNERIQKRPNILFIYTDDQSQRTVSAYEDDGAWSWVQTPNIDRLASEGVRFTTAYGASWCSPSRACVLSGLLPHGIDGMKLLENRDSNRLWACIGDGFDPNVVPFWPPLLRKTGYKTAIVGKWHLGQNAGHGWLWDYSVVWDQNSPKGDWYNDPVLEINGSIPTLVSGYSTDVYTNFADDYIRRKHNNPWFLWLCYNAPHSPYTTHPRYDSTYRDANVPIPTDIFGPRTGKPDYIYDFTMFNRAPDGIVRQGNTPLAQIVPAYNRLVSSVDEGVGKLLTALEETGQLDNTLIIFTSDQGIAKGEHGLAIKARPYDACLRMPLIFRLPGQVASGEICAQPVSLLDVIPTLLSFAGMPLPWEMHGNDLRKLLLEPTNSLWNNPVLMEHFGQRFGSETDSGINSDTVEVPREIDKFPYWVFIRQGRYKYICNLNPDEIDEFYDLKVDPQELKNLALDVSYRSKIKDYQSRLLSELTRTNAGYVNVVDSLFNK